MAEEKESVLSRHCIAPQYGAASVEQHSSYVQNINKIAKLAERSKMSGKNKVE
jgi:hypothetical protein